MEEDVVDRTHIMEGEKSPLPNREQSKQLQERPIEETQPFSKENVVNDNVAILETHENEQVVSTQPINATNVNDCFLELFSTAWAQETPGGKHTITLVKTTRRRDRPKKSRLNQSPMKAQHQ